MYQDLDQLLAYTRDCLSQLPALPVRQRYFTQQQIKSNLLLAHITVGRLKDFDRQYYGTRVTDLKGLAVDAGIDWQSDDY